MYFPYLFGKRGEMVALRDLSGPLGSPQKVVPLIEPVKVAPSSLTITLTHLKTVSAAVYLIVNPSQDEFGAPATPTQATWHAELAPFIADSAVVTPTFLQTATTPLADLRSFVAAHPSRPLGVVLTTNDIAPVDVSAALSGTSHVVFLHRAVARSAYETALGTTNTVDVDDNFIPQSRNVDYSGTDGQGTNHLGWSGRKAGFSDYTVLPGTYRDTGGGPMGALVIHLTYEEATEFRVQHFVSTTDAQTDPLATKFQEAITDLETQMAVTPARFRRSPGLNKFLDQQVAGDYTSAEGNKKQQIAHHIYTVGKFLGL